MCIKVFLVCFNTAIYASTCSCSDCIWPTLQPLPRHCLSRASVLAETSSRASLLGERNCLLNRKRKGKGVPGSKFKNKPVNMWMHECVCLSKADQERTPTAIERAGLISSGGSLFARYY